MKRFSNQEQFDYHSLRDIHPRGWMKQQMQDDLLQGFAGRLDELCDRASSRIFTENHATTIEATEASMVEDNPRSWWDGETQAVWWDGLIRMAYLSGEPAAIEKADTIMAALLASQEDSGYIGIYTEASRYRHPKDNGEFWTQSRAFVAMLAYYELTGKNEYLEAVEKAMALTMQEYGPHRTYFTNETPAGGTCHGLMLVDVCEWLYRLTGKAAYRDYGAWCYEDYCHTETVREKDNLRQRLLLLREDFVGHTPHTTEHLRVALWVAYTGGRAHDRQAAVNAFDKIERYLTPSGACIGEECIMELAPLPDMRYEYCAITELLTSWQSAGQKTGLPEMGDRIEWLAFNAAQGARLADGKGINYLSMDNRERATEEGNKGRRKFSPTHEDVAVCCNPNAVKLLPYYTSRMWFKLKDTEGVCAFCYGPSQLSTTIAGTAVTIVEATEYPFSESIAFQITPDEPVDFELRIRIPGWATGYTLEAGDAEIVEGGGFCRIRKTWQKGDRVSIAFDCNVEPLVACNGEVGARRGPLLYSLPIAAEETVLKEYDVPGFADTALTPAGDVPNLRIDPDHLAFTKEQVPGTDKTRPWHESPVALKGTLPDPSGDEQAVTLVPMGCTTLRRTTFEIAGDGADV